MSGIERQDDFQVRRQHLAGLSETELEERFRRLADELVAPLCELARTSTTPSIERSVLLRMGFSSLEAKAIVDGCIARGLIGKGAGHVVYRASLAAQLPVREAGLRLAAGELWDRVADVFAGQSGRGERDDA